MTPTIGPGAVIVTRVMLAMSDRPLAAAGTAQIITGTVTKTMATGTPTVGISVLVVLVCGVAMVLRTL